MNKVNGLDCILLIEDDNAINFMHKMAIKDLGIDTVVEVCMNGKEGLDYLTNNGKYVGKQEFPKPGLIFLDINMPLMNGWEFLDEYQHLSPEQKGNIVVAMVSASINPTDKKRAMENSQVSAFVPKPLDAGQIKAIIDENFKI